MKRDKQFILSKFILYTEYISVYIIIISYHMIIYHINYHISSEIYNVTLYVFSKYSANWKMCRVAFEQPTSSNQFNINCHYITGRCWTCFQGYLHCRFTNPCYVLLLSARLTHRKNWHKRKSCNLRNHLRVQVKINKDISFPFLSIEKQI